LTTVQQGGKSVSQNAIAAANKVTRVTLRQLLLRKGSGLGTHGPAVIEHCILTAQLKPSLRILPDTSSISDAELQKLVDALHGASAVTQELDRPGQEGYILYKLIKHGEDVSEVCC
jgi:hypothetical protein